MITRQNPSQKRRRLLIELNDILNLAQEKAQRIADLCVFEKDRSGPRLVKELRTKLMDGDDDRTSKLSLVKNISEK